MTIIVSFKALLLWLLFGTIKDEVVYIVHTRISLGPYFGLKIAKKMLEPVNIFHQDSHHSQAQ